MKRIDYPSWSVNIDGSEDLNFAIYIGCTYDLLPKNKPFSESKRWSSTTLIKMNESDRLILSSQWSNWWDQLVSAHSLHGHNFEFYSPPYFESLDKELGEICRTTWKAFSDWWQMPAGGNTAMIFWTSVDKVGEYVMEFEREVDRKVKPFRMRVDLVYAGLDDLIEVSDEYVIMPLRSTKENKLWWSQKIHAIG